MAGEGVMTNALPMPCPHSAVIALPIQRHRKADFEADYILPSPAFEGG